MYSNDVRAALLIYQHASALSPFAVFSCPCLVDDTGIPVYKYQALHLRRNLQSRRNEAAVRPMTMGTRCCKVFFPNYSKNKSAEDTLVPPLWGKRETLFFRIIFVHAAVRGGTCASTLKIVNTLIKNSSRDDRLSISTYKQPTANAARVGHGW